VATAQDDTREEFWPKAELYVGLNQKSRLFFLYSATKKENSSTFADGMMGVHLDFFSPPILRRSLLHRARAEGDKLLLFRVGYLHTPAASSEESREHTLTMEASPRFPLPYGVLLTDRNRGDLRFVGDSFLPRYRNRLKLERSYRSSMFEWTPFAYVEAFFDSRWNKFHRFRFAGGAEVSFTNWVVLELYFVRQNDSEATPRFVNATGVTVQFHLR
jgi:hypothetical protein